jgi:alpha-D-xyloside xylohydrolase
MQALINQLVNRKVKKRCNSFLLCFNFCPLGCCWTSAGENSVTPWCFYGTELASGYSLTNFMETDIGFTGELTLLGNGTSTYGADISKLLLEVIMETSDIIRVKLTDATKQRWEIPETVLSRSHVSAKPATQNYKFQYTALPFSFAVLRISDDKYDKTLFKVDANSIVFKDQYIELGTSYDEGDKIFGLGESTRLNHALAADTTYSMWAADIGALGFDRNLYGSFPFYLQLGKNGAAHGAMLLNSNGMDVVLKSTSLTFKTIGGIIDLYVFAGNTPSAVTTQLTSIVGRPSLMPYWSYGFHNCKYGYKTVWEVEEVVANYTAAKIPLDTQWMDIDYMQNYRDFTTDSVNFPTAEVASFVNGLHKNGQHFVPIVDPGIMVYSGYDAYEKGMKMDIFIKDIKGSPYLGQVSCLSFIRACLNYFSLFFLIMFELFLSFLLD